MFSPAVATGNPPVQSAPALRVIRRPDLAALAEKVRQLQAGRRGPLQRYATGLTRLDAALGGGFARGCIHELLAPGEAAPARSLAFWVAARVIDGAADNFGNSIQNTADTAVPHRPNTAGPTVPHRPNTADTAVPHDHLKKLAGWHGRVGRERTGKNANASNPAHASSMKWALYIDTGGDFYPPAAAQFGLPLEQLLVIRTKRNADALWVCEQALRCKAVAVVVLPIRTIDTYVSRRLQLAAETGGGLGLLVRSDARGGHTFAATRLRLDLLPNRDVALRLNVFDVGTVPKGRQSIAQGASPGVHRQRMESPAGATETRIDRDCVCRPSGAEILEENEFRGLTPPAIDYRPCGAEPPDMQPGTATVGTNEIGRQGAADTIVSRRQNTAVPHRQNTAGTAAAHLKDFAGWHDLVDHATRRIQVTLLKLRDGRPAEPFELVLPPTASREAIPTQEPSTLPPSFPRSRQPASAS